MLTKSLAADLLSSGVTVNATCPGWVRTDMSDKILPVHHSEEQKL